MKLRRFEKKAFWKYFLTRLGARLTPGAIYHLGCCVDYLEIGRWMHAQGMHVPKRVAKREQLFDMVGRQVGERDVLYLEFGVFRGRATRYWSNLLRNPRSKLHGFDSFEGLPDDWAGVRPRTDFDAGGAIPQIDDPRVQFYKGWFDQTLPVYEVPAHEVLVVNVDADLYASAKLVLDQLERAIVPGSYLYFDELNHRFHEQRAFDEFLKRTGAKFSVVGATHSLAHAMFQRTA